MQLQACQLEDVGIIYGWVSISFTAYQNNENEVIEAFDGGHGANQSKSAKM